MTSKDVDLLFGRLREVIVPFVRVIVERGRPVEDSFLHGEFDIAQQRTFGITVAEAFGYDFSRGRLDESVHPFETSFHPDDVRITTRYQRNYLPSAMFAIFHEAGHALYEQGIPPALARTGIGRGAGMGLHESQSRMWENLVGRSTIVLSPPPPAGNGLLGPLFGAPPPRSPAHLRGHRARRVRGAAGLAPRARAPARTKVPAQRDRRARRGCRVAPRAVPAVP